jgi:NADH-quinone oxidoreductase subunit J
MPSGELILFAIIAVAVVATALAMVLSRNAVYSVLFLVMNFASVAALYMILGAPFIALAQVTVYAGAIMVLFLFVVMLLGGERMPEVEHLKGQRWLAGGAFLVLVVEGFMIVVLRGGLINPIGTPSAAFSNPADVGMALFTQYMLPFELTSVILVVAAVGAIVLTRRVHSLEKGKEEFEQGE